LARFSPGIYRGATAVNEIIQHQFSFYQKLLCLQVEKLPIRSTLDFLLSQYDNTGRIFHGDDITDPSERESWTVVQPMYRRAIKYIAEMLCIASTYRNGSRGPNSVEMLESAVTCAESMVCLAHESDLAHSIFPEDCVVTVFGKGPTHCSIAIGGSHAENNRSFQARVICDRESRERFIPHPQFDIHTDTHATYLNAAFQKSFNMGYGEFIDTIILVIDNARPVLNGPSNLFVNRDTFINEIAKSGRPRQAIECAINGFSIFARRLIEERRVVWNPKQENRAYRRGFYVFPHQTGLHLAFSHAMAQENLMQLVNWVSYKHLPKEWQTLETKSALNNLAHAGGEWFEQLICRRLSGLGFVGQSIFRNVKNQHERLQIPNSIGDIDFLGYHKEQRLLVVLEAKMVMAGEEARYWRDDLDEFVFRSGSYAEHFRKKQAWVKANAARIASILGYGPVRAVGAAMLTLYPCIARDFITDFPCVSLTEFMLDYERSCGWPYRID
jgi:hypothetical protein